MTTVTGGHGEVIHGVAGRGGAAAVCILPVFRPEDQSFEFMIV